MANVLQQPFYKFVTQQISQRQQFLGRHDNRDAQTLLYYNSRAPWIRLASSVDIQPFVTRDSLTSAETQQESRMYRKLLNLGYLDADIKESNAAKNFILQGGVLSLNDQQNDPTNYGYAYGLNQPNKMLSGAYGWGGTTGNGTLGFRPMPAIMDVSVEFQNQGALTSTQVNIKCFNKKQLSLLDALYLRPGYTVLLEFGWSAYIDNATGQFVPFNDFPTIPLQNLFNPPNKKYTIYSLLEDVKKTREKYSGNYEGAVGKITNFSWKFNPQDASYDCTVKISGYGEVIQSLSMNLSPPDVKEAPSGSKDNVPPVIANKDQSLMHKNMYEIYSRSVAQSATPSTRDKFIFTTEIINNFPLANIVPDGNSNKIDFTTTSLTLRNSILSIPKVKTDAKNVYQSPQCYITFGHLLALLERDCLLYDVSANTTTPIIRFDVNYENLDEDENFMLKFPGEFSSDPNICLIPYESPNPEIFINLDPVVCPSTELNNYLLNEGAKWTDDKHTYLGRMCNIYININHIVKRLDSENKNGELKVMDFVKKIISDVTKSLGKFNEVTIHLDNESNVIKFIENIPQRFDDGREIKPEKEYARFNVYGVGFTPNNSTYNPTGNIEGSFVKNISLNAQISNNFAAQITVGAQANGNKASTNSVSFSNYNEGLVDRLMPTRQPTPAKQKPEDKKNTQKPRPTALETLVTLWNDKILSKKDPKKGVFYSIYNQLQWNIEDIKQLKSNNYEYAKLMLGELAKNSSQILAPFFLPFELSLDLDGISGITLHSKFLMTEDVLPTSYENDSIDLKVSAVNQKVSATEWTTTIKAISMAKDSKAPIKRPGAYSTAFNS